MTDDRLLIDVREGIATLTLNRPDKLNAIDPPLGRALLQALRRLGADAAVRVLRLRGAGRAFCAGRDVSAPPTDEDLTLVQAVSKALVRLPQPVVFSVHGWTVGAGLEWMLDGDLTVAAASTRFRLPEASIGVFVTGGLSATLVASAGLARAKALTLLGEPFTAAQARDWGLVWDVVPDEQLEARAQALCAQLAALRPEVAASFKRVFNQIGLAAFDAAVEQENAVTRALMGGPPAGSTAC